MVPSECKELVGLIFNLCPVTTQGADLPVLCPSLSSALLKPDPGAHLEDREAQRPVSPCSLLLTGPWRRDGDRVHLKHEDPKSALQDD